MNRGCKKLNMDTLHFNKCLVMKRNLSRVICRGITMRNYLMQFLLSLNRVSSKELIRGNDSDIPSLLIGCSTHLARDYSSVICCLSLPLKVSSSRLAALLRHRLSLPKCCLGRQNITFWNTTRVFKGRRISARVKMASPKTVPKDAQVHNASETVLSPCCAICVVFKPQRLKQHV